MLRRRGEDASGLQWQSFLPALATALSLVACAAVIVASSPDQVGALSIILGVASVAAGLLVVGELGGMGVSAGFIVAVLAAAFLGPASAAIAAVVAELTATARMKTPWRVVVYTNLPPAVMSAVAGAIIIRSLAGPAVDDAGFYLAVA